MKLRSFALTLIVLAASQAAPRPAAWEGQSVAEGSLAVPPASPAASDKPLDAALTSVARFIVEDFSPEPCIPPAPSSLIVTSTDLPNVKGLTVVSGTGTTGELDVNLGWFTLSPTDYAALANVLNGADGTVIDITFKLKNGKKVISKVEFQSEDDLSS